MNTITQAIEDLKKHNPLVGALYENRTSLQEHSRQLSQAHIPDHFKLRQAEIKKLILQRIKLLFGKNFPFHPLKEEEPIVMSTLEHHGLLNDPYHVSASSVLWFSQLFKRNQRPDIFTFATGNIPFSNVVYKRGLDFVGKHINILPKKFQNRLVLSQPGYPVRLAAHARSSASRDALGAKHQKPFGPAEMEFLQDLDQEIFRKHQIRRNYSDQCTVWNYYLWPKLFTPALQERVLRLFILQLEDVISPLLTSIIKHHRESFIYRMLFDPKVRQRTLELFEGLSGCWTLHGERKGTVFFFSTNQEGKRIPLSVENNVLQSVNGSFQLNLSEEAILENLANKKIYPGMFLFFMMVAFWAGIKCLGGASQFQYLEKYRSKLKILLAEIEDPDQAFVDSVDLSSLSLFSLFLKKEQGVIKEMSALDTIYTGGLSESYISQLSALPVKDIALPMLPFCYNVFVPQDQQQYLRFSNQELLEPMETLFD